MLSLRILTIAAGFALTPAIAVYSLPPTPRIAQAQFEDCFPFCGPSSFGGDRPTQTSNATSSGTHTFNDQTIAYELRGNWHATADVQPQDNGFEVLAQVDQTDHRIIIAPTEIIYNGSITSIDGFQSVEIVIEYDQVAIAVDGQPIISRSAN